MTDALGHIGRGWAFPLRVDGRGGIALIGGEDEIEASLRMILSTALGERVMRPDFGCEIWDLVFDPLGPNTLGTMNHAVRRAAAQWEPRVDLVDVAIDDTASDEGRVDILLTYRIKATNDTRNLVYPFYAIPREEQGAPAPAVTTSADGRSLVLKEEET
jgi:phage baseplate assembly protein W